MEALETAVLASPTLPERLIMEGTIKPSETYHGPE